MITNLTEAKHLFEQNALLLGDYKNISKTDLANGYCDAQDNKDEVKRSQYYSALLVRYWGSIPKWIVKEKNLNNQPEDFIEWLSQALFIAFKYRAWRYEYVPKLKKTLNKNYYEFDSWKLDENGNKISNKLYYKNDSNSVDKIINRCLFSVRGMFYQFANKDKRKVNTQTYSVEGQTDENGDCALDYMGCTTEAIECDGTTELVNYYIKKSKVLEALIIDGIVNGDSFKSKKVITRKIEKNSQGVDTNKKYIDYESGFDKRKLVQHLNSIDEKYIANEFCRKYKVDITKSDMIYKELKNTKNSKLYKFIDKTLIEIRDNKRLLSCLTGN